MNCRMQARPLPESEKDNITFCKIGLAHEPNTGERDEQAEMFGQGRSPKRQERDARSFSAASFALAIVIIALAMLYFPN